MSTPSLKNILSAVGGFAMLSTVSAADAEETAKPIDLDCKGTVGNMDYSSPTTEFNVGCNVNTAAVGEVFNPIPMQCSGSLDNYPSVEEGSDDLTPTNKFKLSCTSTDKKRNDTITFESRVQHVAPIVRFNMAGSHTDSNSQQSSVKTTCHSFTIPEAPGVNELTISCDR